MILSFNFGLYPTAEMRRLTPHLTPIVAGLEEGGHRVERFAIGLKPPPAINVLVYHRQIATSSIDEVVALKRQRPEMAIGLFSPAPVNDDGEPAPVDPPALVRLVEMADFVWSGLPPEGVAEFSGFASKTVRVRYGFSPWCLGVNIGPEAPQARDIDILFRGLATPRRQAVADELARRGLSGFWMDNASFPSYLTHDLLGRSKVALDFNQQPQARGRSPALSAQSLHHGAVVVSEAAPAGWQTEFDEFVVVTPYEELADRCQQIVQTGFYNQLAPAALQKFREKTSMRAYMDVALSLPFFERYA